MKISQWITSITLGFLSFQIYAAQGYMPPHWAAHHPGHLIYPNPNLNPRLKDYPSGMTPKQIIKTYIFPPNFQGSGQVVAIVDAYDDPNIEDDLNVFSKYFGLPACTTDNGCFKKIFASGTIPTGGDPGVIRQWAAETALDVEWVHAIAPLAKIILIETDDQNEALINGVTVALQNHPNVVSCSWGYPEFSSETSYDPIFQNSQVPIVVASGDSGSQVNYPATSPYVLSVGGTYLTFDTEGDPHETAWQGSGGGVSIYETEPSYQSAFPIPQDLKNGRGVPDVSYYAGAAGGFAIYDSFEADGWEAMVGTSAGAPQWAALIAIANGAAGKNLTFANPILYDAAHTSYSTMFNDITEGNNGQCGYFCQATTGYDYVTGLGSPKAQNLIAYISNKSVKTHSNITTRKRSNED